MEHNRNSLFKWLACVNAAAVSGKVEHGSDSDPEASSSVDSTSVMNDGEESEHGSDGDVTEQKLILQEVKFMYDAVN